MTEKSIGAVEQKAESAAPESTAETKIREREKHPELFGDKEYDHNPVDLDGFYRESIAQAKVSLECEDRIWSGVSKMNEIRAKRSEEKIGLSSEGVMSLAESGFKAEEIESISKLANAFGLEAGVKEAKELAEIVRNRKYLSFISRSLLTYEGMWADYSHALDRVKQIEAAGHLDEMLDALDHGLSIGFDLFRGVFSERDLDEILKGYEDSRDRREAQDLLKDEEARDFGLLLVSKGESNLATYHFKSYFEDKEKREKLVYLTSKLPAESFYNEGDSFRYWERNILESERFEEVVSALLEKGFSDFISGLEKEMGYKVSTRDIFHDDRNVSDTILEYYRLSEKRKADFVPGNRDIYQQVFKGDTFKLNRLSTINRLGGLENREELFALMKKLNIDVVDYVNNSHFLYKIEQNRDLHDGLQSKELAAAKKILNSEISCVHNLGDLIKLYENLEDPKLVNLLGDKARLKVFSEILGSSRGWGGLEVAEVFALLERSEDEISVMKKVSETFDKKHFVAQTEPKTWEIVKRLTEDKEYYDKLFSKETVSIIKKLVSEYGFYFHYEYIDKLLTLDSGFFDFLSKIEKKYPPEYSGSMKKDNLGSVIGAMSFYEDQDSFFRLADEVMQRGIGFDFRDIHREDGEELFNHLDEIFKFMDLAKGRVGFDIERFYQLKTLKGIAAHGEVAVDLIEYLREYFEYGFDPRSIRIYELLLNVPDIMKKLEKASGETVVDWELFAKCDGEIDIYQNVELYLGSRYYKETTDAARRYERTTRFSMGDFALDDRLFRKLFEQEGLKPREVDLLLQSLLTANGLIKTTENEDWAAKILKQTEYSDIFATSETATKEMAISLLYPGLSGEELAQKKSEIFNVAEKRPEFREVLKVIADSLGIFAGEENRDELYIGVRNAFELCLGDPKTFAERRFEASEFQFTEIFSGMEPELAEDLMKFWKDLTKKRIARTEGTVLKQDDITKARLGQIREIIREDTAVHLSQLVGKVMDTESIEYKHRDLLKTFLDSQNGLAGTDLVKVYKDVSEYIASAKRRLKSEGTTAGEKAEISKALGSYRSLAEAVRCLYKLGTINEKAYERRKEYVREIEGYIKELKLSLRNLGIVDPEKRSETSQIRSLEGDVLLDLSKITDLFKQESVAENIVMETSSTVDFLTLAKAPEMTTSCQRLTEKTYFNDAAYSRLLDGVDEMVAVYEIKEGKKKLIGRSFIELTKLTEGDKISPCVLMDRLYIDPQYLGFREIIRDELINHMMDRIGELPVKVFGLAIEGRASVPPQAANNGEADEEQKEAAAEAIKKADESISKLFESRGFRFKTIESEEDDVRFLFNKSRLKGEKYYDTFGGEHSVTESYSLGIWNLRLAERVG